MKVSSSQPRYRGGMRASSSSRAVAPCRQQSQRTTRRTPLSVAGFQPVSSQRSQGIDGERRRRGAVDDSTRARRNLQSIEVASQLTGALRSPQLLFRARFDLPDALAREAEHVADFLQGARLAVAIETEAQRHHLALLVVELVERLT